MKIENLSDFFAQNNVNIISILPIEISSINNFVSFVSACYVKHFHEKPVVWSNNYGINRSK